MAEEATEATVESGVQETSTANETPNAEETLTQQIEDAETATASTEEKPADENSGEPKEEQEQPLAVDPALFARAIRAGLSENDVIAFGSEQALSHALTLLESRQTGDAPPADARGAAQAPQVQQQPPDVKEPEWKLEGMDGVDESIVKALNGVPQYVKAALEAQMSRQNPEVAKLKDELQYATNYIREYQAEQTTAEVDRWIASQGAEWEKILGKGTYDDLDPKCEAMMNRQRLYKEALIQEKAFLASGQRPPSIGKLLDRARSVLFQKQAESQAQKKVLLRAKSAKGAFLAKPSNRTGIPTTEDAEKKTLETFEKIVSQS